ncbi:ATP-binding protein [Streptomyces sp. NPDC050564]|uniref:ATP-binding protein n=1 Tax=Streptomyces sp. NPDC050564 TaxID=3365631 RepID=UPI0037B143D8
MTDTQTTRARVPRVSVRAEGDSPAGIAHARDAVRAFADELDPAAAPGTAETLALGVSELTTNGLRHGGGRYTLQLTATADAVNVAVSDLNPAPPRERAPDLNAGTGGFGGPSPHQQGDHHPRPLAGQDHPRPPPTATPAAGTP